MTASPGSTPFKSALLRLCKGRAGTQEVKVVERLGGVSDGIELNVVDNPAYVHTTLTTLHKTALLPCPAQFPMCPSEHFLLTAHLFPTVHTCSSQCTCEHCSSACAQIEDYTHTMYNVHAESCKVNTSSTSVHILRVDTESCTLQSARLTDAVVVEPWNLTCDRTHISFRPQTVGGPSSSALSRSMTTE